MKRLRWQILIVILALAAIVVLLIGQQPPAIPQVFEPEPISGGTYAEALIGTPSRLNPLLATNNPVDQDVTRLLYSSLIRFDDRGLAQAELAESWGVSRDSTVYNFSLRPDAVWHDGQPVVSDDILFTVELLRSPDLPIPEDIWAVWTEVEVNVLNDHNLQFRLPEPFAPFLDYLTFGVLPSHLFEGVTPEGLIDDPFNLAPVGSGPFRFENFIVEDGDISGVALRAFDQYYGGRPYIDELNFYYFLDDNAALEAYRAGDIQGIGLITNNSLPEALKEENLNLHTSRLPEMSMIFLNLDNPEVPFFQDVNIRRALLMGLNRQWMINQFLDAQGVIADGPVFPNTWAFYEGVTRVEYDQEKAIRMLKEAGYTIPATGGTVRANEDLEYLSFSLLYPDVENYGQIAEAVKEQWAALGVGVTLQSVSYDTLVSGYLDTRLYEAALVSINLSNSPDPDPYPFWHQTQATGGQNYSLWNDRQASEYLEQARIIVDPVERTRLYRNFQVRWSNELPALPLFYPMYTYGVDAEVQGVRMGPLFTPSDRFANATEWFLFSERVVGSGESGE
jgi:peptide/nickel transport system substrate-binding protein